MKILLDRCHFFQSISLQNNQNNHKQVLLHEKFYHPKKTQIHWIISPNSFPSMCSFPTTDKFFSFEILSFLIFQHDEKKCVKIKKSTRAHRPLHLQFSLMTKHLGSQTFIWFFHLISLKKYFVSHTDKKHLFPLNMGN